MMQDAAWDVPLPHGLLKQSGKQSSLIAPPPGLGMSMTTAPQEVLSGRNAAMNTDVVKRFAGAGRRKMSLASDTTADPEYFDSSETDSLSGHSGGPGSCEWDQNEVTGQRTPPNSSPADFQHAAAMAVAGVPRGGKGVHVNKKVIDKQANAPKGFGQKQVPFECSPEAFAAAWRGHAGVRDTPINGPGAGKRGGNPGFVSPGPVQSNKQNQKRSKDDVSGRPTTHRKYQSSPQPLPPGPLNRGPVDEADVSAQMAQTNLRNQQLHAASITKPKTEPPAARVVDKARKETSSGTQQVAATSVAQADENVEATSKPKTIPPACGAPIKKDDVKSRTAVKPKEQEEQVQPPPPPAGLHQVQQAPPPARVPLPRDLAAALQDVELPVPGRTDKPLKIFMPELKIELTCLDPSLPCKKRVPDWGF